MTVVREDLFSIAIFPYLKTSERFVVRRDWNFARAVEPATTLLKF
jgi:hypothetical protein